MSRMPASDDVLLFSDDQMEEVQRRPETWPILVVDDEEDVHEATELALRDAEIEGRRLAFVHAYSARQAFDLLAADPGFAVVLLDVVMEADDAGLQLVRRIREELDNQAIRVILRTGQPGYAPEIETIRAFDINDYRTKSELTRARLFTSLIVAIRSYRQIRQLELGRHGLELIVSGSTGLGKLRALRLFAEGVVTQLCALFDISPEGLICVACSPRDGQARVIAAAGCHRDVIQCPLDDLPDAQVRATLQTCLERRTHIFGADTCLYFDVSEARGIAAYVDIDRGLDPLDRNLIEVFCANVSVGFDNVLLHQRLLDSAYYDPLLRLPNRNRLIQLIDEPGQGEDRMLALVDLDDFAEINAVLGHRFGDLVLRAVATRLAQSFAPPAVVARVTADAFGLLGHPDEITRSRIEQIFAVPFDLRGEVMRISATASLIPVGPQPAGGGGDVLKDASIALKQAKLLNRGRAVWFSADLSLAAQERIRMLTSLRTAFSTERLFLVFQPQVELATARVVGAEALLRWRDEDGQLIPPDRFIPMAEQSGLMVPIGTWVLDGACRQLQRLEQLGYRGVRMAVNVSQTQFREPDFIAVLARALNGYQVAPEQIELELTESVAIGHIESTATKISEIRRMGVSIALDDFGTGYSSLNVLRQLEIDRLKIDRSFVQEADRSGDGGIANLVVALGRQMNLGIIAEGVETEEQRQHLLALGCREGQGYLFERPLPREQFEDWLAARIAAVPPAP